MSNVPVRWALACALLGASASACSDPCAVPGRAIVTDIDATLTTSDLEFLTEILDGRYDPAERPYASELISAYSERGYFVLYLTSRPESLVMGQTGETSEEATLHWLFLHGFPVAPDRTRLTLSPDLVFGDSSAAYKGDALVAMEAEGFVFEYAYGNATSDIDAYEAAGIAKDATFIIGPEAGVSGTTAVAGEDWVAHYNSQMPEVGSFCSFD